MAAVDVGLVVAGRGNHDAAADPGGVVVVIDPGQSRVVGRVGVGLEPTVIATGFGGVLGPEQGRRHRYAYRRSLAPRRLDAGPRREREWVDCRRGRRVVRRPGPQDERTDRGGEARAYRSGHRRGRPTVRDAHGASVVAAARSALWTTGYLGGNVRGAARSDAATGAFSRVMLSIYGDLIAARGDAVYYVTASVAGSRGSQPRPARRPRR